MLFFACYFYDLPLLGSGPFLTFMILFGQGINLESLCQKLMG